MPVRRKVTVRQKTPKSLKIFKVGIIAVFLLLVLFFLKVLKSSEYVSENEKLTVAVQNPENGVSLLIFDLANKEIVNIVIPGDTEVETARSLGKYRLKNVWKLGDNEGMGGGFLVSQTVTSYFNFPNYIWASEEALGFLSSNPMGCYKAALTNYETNLRLGDRLSLAGFCTKVKNINRSEINLGESTFLKKKILPDGDEGYVLTNIPSPKLYSNFALNILATGDYKVSIVDGTVNGELAKKAASVIEILGAKVSSITKSDGLDFNCAVTSSDGASGLHIARVYGCTNKIDSMLQSNSIEVKLGKKFSEAS